MYDIHFSKIGNIHKRSDIVTLYFLDQVHFMIII